MDETRKALARAVEIVRETRDEFLSEEYAVGQPAASFLERFACNQAASAIENEFGVGTMEQCALLGKPTPFQVIEITEVLKPFAEAVEGCIDEDDQDRWNVWEHAVAMNITVGDLRRITMLYGKLVGKPDQPIHA